MTRCIICEKRPSRQNGYCNNCNSQLKAQRGQKQEVFRFLAYRGSVVALYRNGDGTVKTELTRRNPENLPKTRTLDLNHYCEGYTREVIKRFKKCVLQLANA